MFSPHAAALALVRRSTSKYFRHIYGRARENSCSDMGVGQPCHSDDTEHASLSTYWNMRLSVAGAAKDAQVQNDILLSDFIRYLVVVGRQPHPGPNFASCVLPGPPHRLAVALPLPEVLLRSLFSDS